MGARGPIPGAKADARRVKFTPGIPAPPPSLCKEGKAEYVRASKEILAAGPSYLQQMDMAVLTIYASNWGRMVRNMEVLKKDGDIITGASGNPYAHPSLNIVQACENKIREACAKLGFSPYDRRRIDREIEEGEKRSGLGAMIEKKSARKAVSKKTARK